MDYQKQMDLGFDQIKAAVLGHHDIFDAWFEISWDFGSEEKTQYLMGASMCLTACIAVLKREGCLQSVEGSYASEFFELGDEDRAKRITAAADKSDFEHLNRLAFIMARCITPYQGRITFDGYMPSVEPLA
jgi:hypothetical protein